MRFVAVRSEAPQARGFRTRDLRVGQRTGTINALRGHLAEFGVVAAQGPAMLIRLAEALEGPGSSRRSVSRVACWSGRSPGWRRHCSRAVLEDADARWLMTIPGVGPITAMAVQAFAPPMESFRRGRDFSAWLGLVPRQHTTGGKPRLGRISKMGQRDLRRLLITGAQAEEGRRDGAGQQDGADRPGAGNRRRRRQGKGKRSTRRDRENQLRARTSDQDLIRVSPYGRRHENMPQSAGRIDDRT